jgi:hypothetical protein
MAHKKIDFTTARWDFQSPPQSPPRISVFWWTFELQVGASSQPSSWQGTVLQYVKKVGRLLCFAMFFSAKLFNWKFMPVSCHLLPLPLHDFQNPMPHAALFTRIQSNNKKKKQGT